MKQYFILYTLIGLLISCKDNLKQEKQPVNDEISVQKANNAGSKETDSLKNTAAVYFLKTKKIPVTEELKKCIAEKIESVETIDFTGDNIPDYICKTQADSVGIGNEIWISSEYKTIMKSKYYSDGFYYRWFINLDNDPEPELFEAIGDEDGADYIISDLNLLNGKNTTLLYLNPVIIENGKKYWGYPWDIKDIKARKNGTSTELFCSLNHKIIRDGNEENDPEHQKQMPVFFFSGHHTQESIVDNVKDSKWLTLEEIIKQTKR